MGRRGWYKCYSEHEYTLHLFLALYRSHLSYWVAMVSSCARGGGGGLIV